MSMTEVRDVQMALTSCQLRASLWPQRCQRKAQNFQGFWRVVCQRLPAQTNGDHLGALPLTTGAAKPWPAPTTMQITHSDGVPILQRAKSDANSAAPSTDVKRLPAELYTPFLSDESKNRKPSASASHIRSPASSPLTCIK